MLDNKYHWSAVAGFLVVFHACYSVIAYRNDLKIGGDEFEGVPFLVVIECLIGFGACAWGAVGFAGELVPIKAEPVELPPVTMEKSDDFMTFTHRGRALNPPGKRA